MKKLRNKFPFAKGTAVDKTCGYPMIATCAEAQGNLLAEAYPKPDSAHSAGSKSLASRIWKRILKLCVGMDAIYYMYLPSVIM